ncbi:MAG: amidase [Sulfobacillus benefaciens]|jgi:aspartyl-tRNA(Asn)/glutamyl-tRNA(Gln) amidotransferase subunit A|uniref:Amidase n=1 Tax=Sulfobacillus benefaciens TaxID=453960 RepID=A0A2T2X3M0_9FIRM|nr:MAG: amidase [Sulfobacillus benefaciens]
MASRIEALHQDFLSGRRDPVSWLEEMEDKIVQVQQTTNAFIHLDIRRARRRAEESWKRYCENRSRGVMDGMLVGLKDLFETANMPTTAGSQILRDYRPAHDAQIVQILRQWGANCDLGKLNLHEFAFGPTSTHSFFGPVRHPLDFGKMAGGSSGGSAVAVATGLTFLALGTDTGGSVRIPAALCGVIGLKPTYERISRGGVIPLSWTLDHVGPLTENLDDMAVFMDLLFPQERFKEQMALHPHTLKVLVPEGPEGTALDEDLQRRFERALAILSASGEVHIHHASLPEMERIRAAQLVIIGSEAANYHWKWLQERAADYQEDVRERLTARSSYLAVQYIEGLRARQELMEVYGTLLNDYDVLILPTVPVYPPDLNTTVMTGYDGQQTDIRNLLVWMTAPFNLLGLPALTLPVDKNDEGFAVSAQIVALWGQEGRLLQVAKMWQDAIFA